MVNFPPRGIGARSIEQLRDAARGWLLAARRGQRAVWRGRHQAGGLRRQDGRKLREQTEGRTLREIIELALQHSGLLEHYRADRDGADRVENLEELVNAAESFVLQGASGATRSRCRSTRRRRPVRA